MIESLHEARRQFFDFLLPEWVDPMYFGTLGLVVIVLINWRYYQRWEDLKERQRRVLRALLFATGVAVLGSLLRFSGAL